jgi:hypothetical protein
MAPQDANRWSDMSGCLGGRDLRLPHCCRTAGVSDRNRPGHVTVHPAMRATRLSRNVAERSDNQMGKAGAPLVPSLLDARCC